MNITIDLPDDLLRKLKLRASREHRTLKALVAELLRRGLDAPTKRPTLGRIVILKDRKTGLPVIQGCRAAPRGKELTPDRIAKILIDQEVEWHRHSG